MLIKTHSNVNLWTAATTAYPHGLAHVVKDIETEVPDDVVTYPGYDLLTQGGDLTVITPPTNGGGPPPEAPTGEPTETNVVQWPVQLTDTDIALTTTPNTVVVGSVFLIDSEYMTVNNVSNVDNPGVDRGSYGTTAATHEAAASVSIWGTPQIVVASASVAKHKSGKR